MSSLTGKPLKGLQLFALMLHARGKYCINNNSDDFHIIGKEKDRHLIRLKESIFINHVKPSLNTRIGFIYAMILWYIASINPI